MNITVNVISRSHTTVAVRSMKYPDWSDVFKKKEKKEQNKLKTKGENVE